MSVKRTPEEAARRKEQEQQQKEKKEREHRSRLIDHFKRAYQIIVGLAIALACQKVFESGTVSLNDPALLRFGIFFITVVPIFHGGDRSLDLKYLGANVTQARDRVAYVWDVYMLLITAILFVKIAQAIPDNGQGHGETHFYQWMAGMLIFDMAVLLIDGAKSRLLRTRGAGELGVYPRWILLNLAMAVVCLYVPSSGLSATNVGIAVLLAAFVRTLLDYYFGRKFMFP